MSKNGSKHSIRYFENRFLYTGLRFSSPFQNFTPDIWALKSLANTTGIYRYTVRYSIVFCALSPVSSFETSEKRTQNANFFGEVFYVVRQLSHGPICVRCWSTRGSCSTTALPPLPPDLAPSSSSIRESSPQLLSPNFPTSYLEENARKCPARAHLRVEKILLNVKFVLLLEQCPGRRFP